jgi:hypothetical protein
MIVTTALAAQYAGTFDVSDTTRIAARNTQPAPIVTTSGGTVGEDVLAADLSTTATARLALTDRFWEYALAYSPTVTAPDVEIGLSPLVLNTGTALVGWHGQFVRVLVSEAVSYGLLNSAFLYAAPTAQGTQMPAAGEAGTGGTGTTGGTAPPAGQTTTGATGTVQTGRQGAATFTYGSSNTAASLAVVTGRHTILTLTASYLASGGLNAAAKANEFPEQYGPLATIAFGDAVSRTDTLTTIVSGGESTTSGLCPPPPGQPVPPILPFCVVETPYFSAQEGLRHRISGAATIGLNLGASAAVARTPYVHQAVVDPIIVASYTEALSTRGTSAFSVSAGFVPTVDIRTGLPSNRAQATLSVSEPLASRTTLMVTAAALQSVPIPVADAYPITSLTGTAEIRIAADRQVDLGIGIQSLWQNQPPYGNLLSNIGYVSVIARLPTARF